MIVRDKLVRQNASIGIIDLPLRICTLVYALLRTSQLW
jgi:hypothetical protein